MKRALLATAGLTCLITASAHAQALRDMPRIPQAQHANIAQPEPEEVQAVGHHPKPVLTLRGIRITDTDAGIQQQPDAAHPYRTKFRGVESDVSFIRRHAKLRRQVASYLGKQTSIDTLNEICRSIERFYAKRGRPFVAVSIPKQFSANGDVTLLVQEYRVGDVSIKNDGGIPEKAFLKTGDVLDMAHVQYALDRLNDNPFRSASIDFSPSDKEGVSNVDINIKQHGAFGTKLPLSAYASYDTNNVPLLGRQEYAVGGSWGNVFGGGGILSYQFTHAVSDKYSAHALNFTQPLAWGDRIQIFGTYAYEHPVEYSQGYRFDEAGHSGQASIRYIHDFLPLSFNNNKIVFRQQIAVGFDFKTTNNNVEFGGVNVWGASANTLQFPITYTARESDPWGETTLINSLIFSPGGMMGGNNNKAFQTLVPGSKASYVYDNVSLKRLTYLPRGWSHTLTVNAQDSSSNLMYSNQLGLGGMYNGRGYFTDTAMGSRGVSVQNEINTPVVKFADLFKKSKAVWANDVQAQAGVFFDYGHVAQVRRISGQKPVDLASVGFDLKFKVRNNVSVLFNIGWRLKHTPTDRQEMGYGNKGAFGNVSLVVGL